ncbi:MAG: cytochrome c oxidase subunit 3 [Chloracidobacterium sp.]|nr:cytochrome c oxidase subunit 3 [Chloracidobacterium sp.]MCO5334835.1 cytochrome c oxidase subunit 3 [Pyrinomonadaceae bacterium]
MNVGTVDTLDDIALAEDPAERSGISIGTGDGGSGGRGGRGGGGGSDGDEGNDEWMRDSYPARYRILTGFLLIVVLMTFGGLFAAYVVLETNKAAEWQPFSVPFQVWISSILILSSSITYVLFERRYIAGEHARARTLLKATAGLGGLFIASQLVLWFELMQRGYYLSGNPYSGFFYLLTAVHAAHVSGGMAALGSLLYKAWKPVDGPYEVERRQAMVRVIGWYWHFMGVLWAVLLFLLAYWK